MTVGYSALISNGPKLSAQPQYRSTTMALPRIVPPLEYLRQASPASLQSFELSRLNHAANLRREISALIDQWIQESSEAMLARWMLDQRNSLHDPHIPASDLFNLSSTQQLARLPALRRLPQTSFPPPPFRRFAPSHLQFLRKHPPKTPVHRLTHNQKVPRLPVTSVPKMFPAIQSKPSHLPTGAPFLMPPASTTCTVSGI